MPGKQQIFRLENTESCFEKDVVAMADEADIGGRPLLEPVMEKGKLLRPHPSIEEIRERFYTNFQALEDKYKALEGAPFYPVDISQGLRNLERAASHLGIPNST